MLCDSGNRNCRPGGGVRWYQGVAASLRLPRRDEPLTATASRVDGLVATVRAACRRRLGSTATTRSRDAPEYDRAGAHDCRPRWRDHVLPASDVFPSTSSL